MTTPLIMTDEDWDRAESEGWYIGLNMQILSYGRSIFKSNEEAEKFVVARARSGSAFHLHALKWLAFQRLAN